MNKGSLVITTARTMGVRPSTQAEIDAWYKSMYAIAPHDSAGESWIHDGTTVVDLPAGTPAMVLRARCTARVGWTQRSGYVEIVGTDGVPVKVPRRDLAPRHG